MLYQNRLRNELSTDPHGLGALSDDVAGNRRRATYNWYWLVDGLMDAGYRVHLAHAPALPQHSGLKQTDDLYDARWLAHLLRLAPSPPAIFTRKRARAVRDLLRKRSQLVRYKTMVVLSLQSLLTPLTGHQLSLPRVRQLTPDMVAALAHFPEQVRSVGSSLTVLRCLEEQIADVEQAVRAEGRQAQGYTVLQTVPGIGPTLALTILFEAGDMRRFLTVGQLPRIVGVSTASI